MIESKFPNTYADSDYASRYARLEWSGTYHLVRRDLPAILERHVVGRSALDFGCGTGRSTRLLQSLGFDALGVDIAESMISSARALDPRGDYRLLAAGELDRMPGGTFDLVLACFPFDNIPMGDKPPLLRALVRLLKPKGRFVNIVSAPEIYLHEWASFTTAEFHGNRQARDGDEVRIITREFQTATPARDIVCSTEAYKALYDAAGLRVEAEYHPLGREDDAVDWVTETRIAPWNLHVVTKK